MKALWAGGLVFGFVVVFCGCAQNTSVAGALGTIDGKPIASNISTTGDVAGVGRFVRQNHRLPDDSERAKLISDNRQRLVCTHLSRTISTAAREAEIQKLGITVSPEEIAAQLAIQQRPDASLAEEQKSAAHLVAAFAAVIDQGEDSHAVYQRLIQQDGVSEDAWLILQDSARNDPATRKRLEGGAVPQAGSAEAFVRDYKLTKAIDQAIAAKDPAYGKYLAELSRGQGPGDAMSYVSKKRSEYWRAATAKLNVRLKDPALFDTCQLAVLGVTVRK